MKGYPIFDIWDKSIEKLETTSYLRGKIFWYTLQNSASEDWLKENNFWNIYPIYYSSKKTENNLLWCFT